MKYHFCNPVFIRSLLNYCNPFGLQMQTGEAMLFKDVTEAYFYVLVKIVTLFPRGYVDIVLLLCHLYPQCTWFEIGRMKRTVTKTTMSDDVELVKVWNSEKCEDFFRQLMVGLHALSETKFNNAAFLNALELFKMKVETLQMNRKNDEIDNESG